MSLLIDIAGIEQVLRADGLHEIRNYSFDIGAYGFKEGPGARILTVVSAELRNRHRPPGRGGPSWTARSSCVPLSSILAVKCAGEQRMARRRRGELTPVPPRARPLTGERPLRLGDGPALGAGHMRFAFLVVGGR